MKTLTQPVFFGDSQERKIFPIIKSLLRSIIIFKHLRIFLGWTTFIKEILRTPDTPKLA